MAAHLQCWSDCHRAVLVRGRVPSARKMCWIWRKPTGAANPEEFRIVLSVKCLFVASKIHFMERYIFICCLNPTECQENREKGSQFHPKKVLGKISILHEDTSKSLKVNRPDNLRVMAVYTVLFFSYHKKSSQHEKATIFCDLSVSEGKAGCGKPNT